MTACIVPGFKKSGICSPPYCRHCPMPEAKLYEAAAFLDRMAERLDKPATWARPRPADAADCREMARKLRGET